MPVKAPDKGSFPPTDWDDLEQANDDIEILNRLLLRYWQPMKAYLLARFPRLGAESDELLQNFAQDKMLSERWRRQADRRIGRFRDFLKTSLHHFILDYIRRADAQPVQIQLEKVEDVVASIEPAADAFDLAWVRIVLAETLRRMEADCRDPKKPQPRRTLIWELFEVRILRPLLDDVEPVSYKDLIDRFGLESPAEAFNMLSSGKRIFRGHLRRVVREYAGSPNIARLEIGDLGSLLTRLVEKSRKV